MNRPRRHLFAPLQGSGPLAATSLALALVAAPAFAQDFTLDRAVIAPGGESSSSGEWTLEATLGQPAAGVAEGDDFILLSGFWTPDSVEPPQREVLFVDDFEGAPP